MNGVIVNNIVNNFSAVGDADPAAKISRIGRDDVIDKNSVS